MNIGTEKDRYDEIVHEFRGKTQLLAFLNAVDSDGVAFLILRTPGC